MKECHVLTGAATDVEDRAIRSRFEQTREERRFPFQSPVPGKQTAVLGSGVGILGATGVVRHDGVSLSFSRTNGPARSRKTTHASQHGQ